MNEKSLSELYPNSLWSWFENICAIPRPSHHEEELKGVIKDWCQKKGLECIEDKVGNLILKKNAYPGFEDKPGVVLQAHLDMVPQKSQHKEFDFTKDAIEAHVDGEWVKAKDTTLGSDNGIGLSSILAIFESKDIKHGPLEALLTVNEEAGMTGVFGLEPGYLTSSYLINTDSEQEGEIYIGCAGGVDASIKLNFSLEKRPSDWKCYQINFTGLFGGHSGCDIHLNRANAIKLLSQFICIFSKKNECGLVSFKGGNLRNAIPRDAEAVIVINRDESFLSDALKAFEKKVQKDFEDREPNFEYALEIVESIEQYICGDELKAFMKCIEQCPNGVIKMNDVFEGVVETSINLGIAELKSGIFELNFLVRSLNQQGQEDVMQSLRELSSSFSGEINFSGEYPGWEPEKESKLRELVFESYKQLFNKAPDLKVIHAGLECGIIKQPYPDLDMISIGPTIKYPHSPGEKVHIESVGNYWKLLVNTLEMIE